ncbi:MAG: glycosyltransferase [Ignavibacteria bacterium]|nr:glycosyltransferase [Ignavibacteria bacterium]
MRHEKALVIGEQELGPYEMYFSGALTACGFDSQYVNIHTLYPEAWKKASNYFHRLPRKFDNSLRESYVKKVNDGLTAYYNKERPSYIFIYNDCLISPDTIERIRNNGTKVITLLGDDPCCLIPGKKTFLLTVLASDFVIVPDSGWIKGLSLLGARNIIFSPIGTDASVFHPVQPGDNDLFEYGCDIIFIGTGYYLNAWGIKRAEVLNSLSGLDFRLFGDSQWLEVLEYYPDLKKHFRNRRLSANEVNVACNCAKIYPVTVNSGVVNGVSTRVFDCIASGIFVIAEYKEDFGRLFPNGEVALFRDKKELRDLTEYFLKNENERQEMLTRAREKVLSSYTLDKLLPEVLEKIQSGQL